MQICGINEEGMRRVRKKLDCWGFLACVPGSFTGLYWGRARENERRSREGPGEVKQVRTERVERPNFLTFI